MVGAVVVRTCEGWGGLAGEEEEEEADCGGSWAVGDWPVCPAWRRRDGLLGRELGAAMLEGGGEGGERRRLRAGEAMFAGSRARGLAGGLGWLLAVRRSPNASNAQLSLSSRTYKLQAHTLTTVPSPAFAAASLPTTPHSTPNSTGCCHGWREKNK